MRIELRQIRKSFGPVKANDGIDLIFEGGKIYGLLGENGAGKSTLMKILSGYQPPDSGEILLDSQSKSFKSPADALKNGIGMVYQDPHDFPPFTILDNYLLGKDTGLVLDFKDARKELTELASRYGFEVDLGAIIDNLSLGERQQLELIRLLAGGAQLLILDEPTTGISAEQKVLLFESIHRLAKEEGKTLILVSHKLDEVQELCDYVFILRRGQLVGESEIPCQTSKLVEMMFGQVPPRSERSSYILGEPAVQLQNLKISTYRLTIDDINLTIQSGEVFGFAGLEGSGQKLVLQACAGILHPEAGKILINGTDTTGWSFHKLQKFGVAYVSAGRIEEGLVGDLSLTEHVILSLPEHKFLVDWKGSSVETQKRIEKYQIVGRPDTTAAELSGGNQQRLLFALLNSPLRLLLLEHPTRGLDVRSADWIWQLLYKRREDGTAIVFMSADLDEIIERSDRIAVFSGGKMSHVVEANKTDVDECGHLIGGQL